MPVPARFNPLNRLIIRILQTHHLSRIGFISFSKIPGGVAKAVICGRVTAPRLTKPQQVMKLSDLLTPSLFCTLGALGLLFCANPGSVHASNSVGAVIRGKASFYGGYWHGRKTANGEIYDQNTLTAAHPTLSFGTKVLVKNLRNGREVTLRINNRGPYVKGRVIDVSRRAAQELRMTKAGVVPVEITVLPKDAPVGVPSSDNAGTAQVTTPARNSKTSSKEQEGVEESKEAPLKQELADNNESGSKSLASTTDRNNRRLRLPFGR